MRYFGLGMLLVLGCLAVRANEIKVEPSTDLQSIRLRFAHPVPDFCSETDCTKGSDAANYKLYEIVNPDNENIHADPRTVINVEFTGCTANGCSLFVVHLKDKLNSGSTYLLKIKGLKLEASASETATLTRFEMSKDAKITTSHINASRRDEIAIQTPALPIAPDLRTFSIVRTQSIIEENKAGIPDLVAQPKPLRGSILVKTPANTIGVKLESKLQQGVAYDLTAKGVTDTSADKNPIGAAGVIEFPGVPDPPDDPRIDFTFSSLAARHQKTVFDFVMNFKPLKRINLGNNQKATTANDGTEQQNALAPNQRLRANWRYSTRWAIEPTAAIDVGFRSTKSNNSITLSVPFTKDFLGGNVRCFNLTDAPPSCGSSAPFTRIPVYAGWSSASLFHLAFVKFAIGPKLETDHKFKRLNTLGELRFEYNFTRFGDAGTIGGRRKNLQSDLDKKARFVEINWGFKMIPYLSFDFGGHVNNETVTNEDKNVSVFVPRHGIFRTYVGAIPTFQWKKFGLVQTLSFDVSLVYLAARETIGFTTDEGAELRSLRGLHPHTLIKWDIAIDPAGHYNFVTTYENGRLAPNFEYLNKTTAGFRIVY